MKKIVAMLIAAFLLFGASIYPITAQYEENTTEDMLITRNDEDVLDLNEIYQSAADSLENLDNSYLSPDEAYEPDVPYSDMVINNESSEEYADEPDIPYEEGMSWENEGTDGYLSNETEDIPMITREETADEPVTETEEEPDGPINPLTGKHISEAELLTYPPVFVPLATSPSLLRPNSGATAAAWVFELYAGNDESRPILMYFGELPFSDDEDNRREGVFPVGSAIFGVESLRRLYRGIIITAPLSATMKTREIYNVEFWYGLPQDPDAYLIPYHPMSSESLRHIMDKWQAKSVPPDLNNLGYSFQEEAPEGGKPANSLYFRYAYTNRIIWQYDVMDGNFKRSQNSVEYPREFTADVDRNNQEQVSAENVVILYVPHIPIVSDTIPAAYGYFDLDLTYTEGNNALIFRDGNVYEAQWTTISENFEVESDRLRPIRILDKNGNNFPLKPGRTWVHIVQPGNPCYEVNETMGTELKEGTGFWKLPYQAFTTRRPIGDWYDLPEYYEVEAAMLNKTETK